LKVTAHKTILWNKSTDAVFLAGKLEETTQLEGTNRSHIVPVGCELTISPPDIRQVLLKLYEEIKHGDDEHQKNGSMIKIIEFSDLNGY